MPVALRTAEATVVELTQELGGECLHCTCGCEQPACALWPARISEVGLVRSPGSLLKNKAWSLTGPHHLFT